MRKEEEEARLRAEEEEEKRVELERQAALVKVKELVSEWQCFAAHNTTSLQGFLSILW